MQRAEHLLLVILVAACSDDGPPECNPLTQERDDGAPACGSPDPAMPTLGCYGFPSQTDERTVFTCQEMGGTRGHREVVTPPLERACLPGALPLVRESTGTMQIVCVAMCQPLPVNNTQPDEARDGAEPFSCSEMPLGIGVVGPVARATGPNERCTHLWFWEGIDTPVTDASNTFGACIDPTRYTWDADQNPATPPEPWSMPETLNPYSGDPLNAQPTDDMFWGYAPLPAGFR